MTNTTQTAKHTPGPWFSGYRGSKDIQVVADDNSMAPVGTSSLVIAKVNASVAGVEANAHLIAAAPAMYEALTTLLPEEDIVSTDSGPDECRWCGRTYPDYDNEGELPVLCTSDDCPGYIARQAIAQAEGKQ